MSLTKNFKQSCNKPVNDFAQMYEVPLNNILTSNNIYEIYNNNNNCARTMSCGSSSSLSSCSSNSPTTSVSNFVPINDFSLFNNSFGTYSYDNTNQISSIPKLSVINNLKLNDNKETKKNFKSTKTSTKMKKCEFNNLNILQIQQNKNNKTISINKNILQNRSSGILINL